jgi:hypothetical protein
MSVTTRKVDNVLSLAGRGRIVSLADNYDSLRYPPATVTRDARYTRYVGAAHVLRSHTTAMIPPVLLRLAGEPADDVLLVCPGITYRRDRAGAEKGGPIPTPGTAARSTLATATNGWRCWSAASVLVRSRATGHRAGVEVARAR